MTSSKSEAELTGAWNESYSRRENFLFWPSDEVIRFFARFIRRRIGANEWRDIADHAEGAKMLDVGCGIGRHVKFGLDAGLEMYGNDLSDQAIATGREWLKDELAGKQNERLVASDIRQLPWGDDFFDHAMSDSVLDSMPFEVAQQGVAEIARMLKPGGYFYCSLISGDESGRDADFCDEVVVQSQHEQDTIQSYFNDAKIKTLLEPWFEIVDCYLVRIQSHRNGTHRGRWHVVGTRK